MGRCKCRSARVREAFERGTPRSIIATLREIAVLGNAIGNEAGKACAAMYEFVEDDHTAHLKRHEADRAGRDPMPPPRLPEGLRELAPSEQEVYELMVEGTIPGSEESDTIRPGPLYRWYRSREHALATYGHFGDTRSVGFAGKYSVARYADGRRCVIEGPCLDLFVNAGGTLSYWVDFLERNSRGVLSAIADLEQALPACTALPPEMLSSRLEVLACQRASALRALYEISPRLLDATASERAAPGKESEQ